MALGPFVLLFASGASALVFQLLWIKQLSLVVGVEIYAITTAVSAFFGGLALGGFLFGRRVERMAHPLRVYALLELGIAVCCVATTLLLERAAAPFATLETAAAPLAWAMVFALVGIPPLLMGGTLPVMVRAVAADAEDAGRAGGLLYAANTGGAVVGALLPYFVLIPAFGVRGAGFAAAALTLVGAAGAYLLGHAAPIRQVADSRPGRARYSPDARIAIALYAIAGGVALGYEIVWSQAILPFMSTRSFAFSVVLATYLVGLAIGSAISAGRVHRLADPWRSFALLIAAAGLAALAGVALLGPWLPLAQGFAEATIYRWTGSDFAGMCARFAVAAGCVVFVPTVLLGAAFPVALRLAGSGHAGRDTGTVIALNTIGGIAGTMLTGFVLVPVLGLVHSLVALAVTSALLGLAAMLGGQRQRLARRGLALGGLLAIAACTAWLAVHTPADMLARLLPAARDGGLAFYEESPAGTVAVIARPGGRNRFHRLYIQGVSNSGDAMPSLRYMRLQALLPLIIHNGAPKSALVIGYGTGITAGALKQFPGLERRAVAELLPAVMRAAHLFDGAYWAAGDTALDIRLRDGRRELQASPDQYDFITLEPPPPSAAGVVNLYSSDFYRLAASRLRAGGLVGQWLPLATQNDGDTRSLVRSFTDVFPYAALWTTELHEALLVGSFSPITLDVPSITARFAAPDTAAALRAVGVRSPAALLATWVTDRDGLVKYAADAPPTTDDDPRIEYAAWLRQREFPRVFTEIAAHRTAPPLTGADASFQAEVAGERATLDRFYRAGLSAYAGDRTQWAHDIAAVMREDGGNPYYAWFVGAPRQ